MMDGRVTPETRTRLQHALERLRGEPRSMERRCHDRRCVLISIPISRERRAFPDRRQTERRT